MDQSYTLDAIQMTDKISQSEQNFQISKNKEEEEEEILTPESISSLFDLFFQSIIPEEKITLLAKIYHSIRNNQIAIFCRENGWISKLLEFLDQSYSEIQYLPFLYKIFKRICKLINGVAFFTQDNAFLSLTLHIIQDFPLPEESQDSNASSVLCDSTNYFVNVNYEASKSIAHFFIHLIRPPIKYFQIHDFLYFFKVCCLDSNEILCKCGFKIINRIIATCRKQVYSGSLISYGFTTIAFQKLRRCDKSFFEICHYLGEIFDMKPDEQSLIPPDFGNLLMNLLALDSIDVIVATLSLISVFCENDFMKPIIFENNACLIKYIIDLENRESLKIKTHALKAIRTFFEEFSYETSAIFFSQPEKMAFFLDFLEMGDYELLSLALISLHYFFIQMNNGEHGLTPEIVSSIIGDNSIDQALETILDDIEIPEDIDETASTIQILMNDARKLYFSKPDE